MAPIKVVRIIARLNVGGPAVHCMLLSEGMARLGFETVLVTGHTDGTEADYTEFYKVAPQNFRLVRLQSLSRSPHPFRDFKALWDLVKVIWKEKPDIVHTHTAKAGLVGRLAAILCGVPVILHTFHGHVLKGYFKSWINQALIWIERALALGTTAIITLSERLKTELSGEIRVASASKFRVIPLGRDLSRYLNTPRHSGQFRHELGLNKDTFLIGSTGRLVPIKNYALLLEASAALKGSWHLVLAGEGPEKVTLQAHCRNLGIERKVSFLGWRSDLAQILSDLDVFALTSNNEGTPLSVIEAFAAGTPVVATRVGGVPDMFHFEEWRDKVELQAEGALVAPEDSSALTDALALFIEGKREACSVRCRETARAYEGEILVERMASLYRELLKPLKVNAKFSPT